MTAPKLTQAQAALNILSERDSLKASRERDVAELQNALLEVGSLKALNAGLLAALEQIAEAERLETGTFVCDFDTLQGVARVALAKARAS